MFQSCPCVLFTLGNKSFDNRYPYHCIYALLYLYFLFMYLYLVTLNAISRLMFQAAAPPPLPASSGKLQMLNHSPGAKHEIDSSLRCKVQKINEI